MQDKKTQFKKNIGKLLREKRISAGKSISLIANEVGISKSVWHEIESGNRDPQLSTMWKIAEGLNIPLSEFLKEMENSLGFYYFLD